MNCPQCGHDQTLHWPNIVDRPTTACVHCLDGQIMTREPTLGMGFCCRTARSIAEEAEL